MLTDPNDPNGGADGTLPACLPFSLCPLADDLQSALAHARRGDRDARTYLYVRYADDVARQVQPLVGDAGAVEALTEQLFAKLHTTLPPDEDLSGEAKFEGWILRRARKAAQAPPNQAAPGS